MGKQERNEAWKSGYDFFPNYKEHLDDGYSYEYLMGPLLKTACL